MVRARAIAALVVSRLEYLITNPWLIGAVALLSLSFTTIVVTGAKALAEHEERYTLDLQQRLRATLQAVGPEGRQVDRALRVIRPPSMAALLIVGQESTTPAGWDLGPGAVEALEPYPAWSGPMPLGGPTDGAALIAQFGGLLALTLGLSTVLRDRRRGWADAERGTTMPASAFLAADLVTSCFALALVVCIWFGTISFVVYQVLDHAWEQANETIWMLAPLTWCYLVALYGYGAALAWHVRGPLRAVAIAAMLWVCLVLIGPQLISYWSSWAGDALSRARAEQNQRDAYTDRVRALEDELGRQVALQVGDDFTSFETERRAQAAFETLEPLWIRGMAAARAEASALERAWRSQSEGIAIRLHQAIRFTPTTLVPEVLAAVSGTGSAMSSRWQDKVDDYKQRLDAAVFDDRPTVTLLLPLKESVEVFGFVRHPVTPFSELPQFVAPAMTARDRWQAAKGDASVLVLHALAALTLAGIAHRRAWRRYDFASVSAADVGIP